MRLKLLLGLLISQFVFGITIVSANTNAGNSIEDGKTFTIGVLSSKARKHIGFSAPLARYLADNLRQYGYTKAEVKVTKSALELGQWLDSGEIDLVSETLFAALALQSEHNGEIILRRWKKGEFEYHTVFFARKDSDINSLSDLTGKTIALEDQSSTSGFYLPMKTLSEHHLAPTRFASSFTPVLKDKVGVVLTGDVLRKADEISLSTWVYRSQVDAAAFSNANWDDLGDMPQHIKSTMKIFYRTESVPRSVMVIRNDLPTEVKQTVKDTLLNADSDPMGAAALAQFQKTAKFDEIPASQLTLFPQYNAARLQVEEAWFN
ncbi:phosphate/phosphite/phosphonate ABC transporter substrate-binding protein [Vibrio mediterranei]|uniref:phosphate/phosphite/phosphonate ABC transporter substrate-binding protein n=1 Tax=Vibrio sp. La 4.2.2 TaxID=2998830 RepID=UPI0022CDD43F|nr:phosphate/phosphite/phosphonate ABC transporter substrate-binding protein [Vibrio sp. La 4.2.2]MDA0107162.1 phosphate/phosphite/phosphonate ABC transporter substrate-binding protein [Vibrio sp. La 4.2.2]